MIQDVDIKERSYRLVIIFSPLSSLQSKASLTSEFITRRVLSNQQIPYQALTNKTLNTNKENYKDDLRQI